MKRPHVRLSTLLLLVLVAALAVALVVEKRRSAALLAAARPRQPDVLYREQAAQGPYAWSLIAPPPAPAPAAP